MVKQMAAIAHDCCHRSRPETALADSGLPVVQTGNQGRNDASPDASRGAAAPAADSRVRPAGVECLH